MDKNQVIYILDLHQNMSHEILPFYTLKPWLWSTIIDRFFVSENWLALVPVPGQLTVKTKVSERRNKNSF